MTPFLRRVHYFAVGFHLAALVAFSACYALQPSAVFVVFAGWSVFYGAQSTLLLRQDRKRKGIRA